MCPSQVLEHRRGTVTVWLLVCLLAIVGILALNLDGGRLMEERRRLQATADAAALAAAKTCTDHVSSGATGILLSLAQDAATTACANTGMTIDGVITVLSVNIPPAAGDYAAKPGYVEIVLQHRLPASFARIFTQEDLTVQARAVARYNAAAGILCLNPTANAALNLGGTARIDLLGSSIYVNSTDSSAAQTSSNTVLTASTVNVCGTASIAGTLTGIVNSNTSPVADPLSAVPAPVVSAYPVQSSSQLIISDVTKTLSPGVYTGGIDISGTATVTLSPGVYILDGGGLSVTGKAVLSGSEVMIYNTGVAQPASPINIVGQGDIVLTPPTSGVYSGIQLFQDRSVGLAISLAGSGKLEVSGTIYNPAGGCDLVGNGAVSSLGSIICNTVSVSGGGTITLRPRTAAAPQNARIRLVE